MKIESNVALPVTAKAKSWAAIVQRVYTAYADAHQAVYGVRPNGYSYTDPYIHIGFAPGVTVKRLKQMTTQLRARVG